MPFLHRLATLRDDVIFFIWLYQKWVYKVDYKRINEFGQGGEEEDEAARKELEGEEKKGEKAVQGQNVIMKPTAAVATGNATASGAEKKAGGKKRK